LLKILVTDKQTPRLYACTGSSLYIFAVHCIAKAAFASALWQIII